MKSTKNAAQFKEIQSSIARTSSLLRNLVTEELSDFDRTAVKHLQRAVKTTEHLICNIQASHLNKSNVAVTSPMEKKIEKATKPKQKWEGIRVSDLPSTITEEEFGAYLLLKQEEAPKNLFWTKPDEVRRWLGTKGVNVTNE